MNSLLSFAALAAYVVGGAMAQSDTALFTNMTFDTVMVGQQLPIYWTAGNGEDVSLTIGNSSWNETIFDDQPALPGYFSWTVAVPEDFVEGNYTLGLSQQDAGSDFSPFFQITFPSTTPDNLTTMTTTYWDHHCGCSKTSMMSPPTTQSASATIYTMTSPCGAMGCSNYTASLTTPTSMNTPVGPAMTSSLLATTAYTGSAPKVSDLSVGFGFVVLFIASVVTFI